MKNAELKVIRFGKEDVIVTSGLSVVLKGVFDNNTGDTVIVWNGTEYKKTADFVSAFGNGITSKSYFSLDEENAPSGRRISIAGMFSSNQGSSKNDALETIWNNQTYTWNGTYFVKQ